MPSHLARRARIEVLSSIWLFARCSRRELSQIAAISSLLPAAEGDVVAREGETGETFFVIASGRARVSIAGTRVGDLGPGGFFGEMALLDGGPRIATVTATTPMQLVVVSRSDFEALLTSAPSVAIRMLAALGGRLRLLDRQLAAIRSEAGAGF